jgi:hypothetical protein
MSHALFYQCCHFPCHRHSQLVKPSAWFSSMTKHRYFRRFFVPHGDSG